MPAPTASANRVADGSEGLAHFWGLGGQASDALGAKQRHAGERPHPHGRALGVRTCSSTVSTTAWTSRASATANEFTLSFWFRMTDNAGIGYRYIYSHGNAGDANTLNVYFIEDATVTGSGAQNVLRTYLRDANDGDHMADLDISATGLADNQWHLYTLTTVTGVGSTVSIDGVQRATSTTGRQRTEPQRPRAPRHQQHGRSDPPLPGRARRPGAVQPRAQPVGSRGRPRQHRATGHPWPSPCRPPRPRRSRNPAAAPAPP